MFFFVLMGLAYSWASPPFENPDEVTHAQYVTFIADYRRLPDLLSDCVRMAFHPPLYYTLAAPLALLSGATTEDVFDGYHINRDPSLPFVILTHGYPEEYFPYGGSIRFVHAARVLSIVLSIVTLVFTWRAALLIFRSGHLAFLAVMIPATLPQFQYISSSISNDSLVTAAASAYLFYVIRLATLGFRWMDVLKVSISLGIGMLSKASMLSLTPLVLLAAIPVRSVSWRAITTRLLFVAAAATSIAGWWYLGSSLAPGSSAPLLDVVRDTWVGQGLTRPIPPRGAEWLSIVLEIARSFVFTGGLMNIRGPNWLYLIWGSALGIGLLGVIPLARASAGRLLICAMCLMFGALIYYNREVAAPQGRYMFPTLLPVAISVTAGLSWLGGNTSRTYSYIAAAILAGASAMFFIHGFVPVYARISPAIRLPEPSTTDRLFCGNVYAMRFPSRGGILSGLALPARRLGNGDFALELRLYRGSDELTQQPSVVSSGLIPRDPGTILFRFPPVVVSAGEALRATFSSPTATPWARAVLLFSPDATANSSVIANGKPLPGSPIVTEILD